VPAPLDRFRPQRTWRERNKRVVSHAIRAFVGGEANRRGVTAPLAGIR
jgi:hypothetical protein